MVESGTIRSGPGTFEVVEIRYSKMQTYSNYFSACLISIDRL